MAKKISITRPVKMPDIVRISRYQRSPDLGPKLLFFSGGSALTDISRVLKKFTHNSTHLVTPFDSGGSSAVLRKVFDMPAIGDLRSRLMALADDSISGNPEVFQLFAYRLPKDARRKDLLAQLRDMADGKDSRVVAIQNPMRRLVRNHLLMFLDAMPEDFDLRGASIGNLILAGGYLNNNRQLSQVIFMFSRLVNVLGDVHPVVNAPLHLAARLKDGTTVIGQHLMTGKEVTALQSPVEDFYLVKSLEDPVAAETAAPKKIRKMILDAEMICYPPGSFYSSLAANLLPKGIGQSIAANPCPKVYMPSLGNDPESYGMTLDDSIFRLGEILARDTGGTCTLSDVLDFVFIDSTNAAGLKRSTRNRLKSAGVSVIDTRLITPASAPYYDPQLMVSALLSLT